MDNQKYTVQKILKVFGADVSRAALQKAEAAGHIPVAAREGGKSNPRRAWTVADLPAIGERYGFLKPLQGPVVAAVFTTKGGVLKSTLALNLARLAALHNQRVCLIGLDMQCDITNALGFEADLDDSESLGDAIERISAINGLANFARNEVSLDGIIVKTDIPTLDLIPETPELVALERMLSGRTMRDLWLRDRVVAHLRDRYDLVVLDCSPNWNLLTSNALMACNVLISPLECKINNFRNYPAFKTFIEGFKKDTSHTFDQVFVPTRFTSTRKLSSEIRGWYLGNVPGCTNGAIRESVHSEEAVACHLSLPEYQPSSLPADEMRELLQEVWATLTRASVQPTKSRAQAPQRAGARAAATPAAKSTPAKSTTKGRQAPAKRAAEGGR